MELEMHRTPALLSDLVPDFYFFPDLEPEMGSQRPSDVNIDEFKIQNFKISNLMFFKQTKKAKFQFAYCKITRPDFHFGVPKKHYDATQLTEAQANRQAQFSIHTHKYLSIYLSLSLYIYI